MSLQIYKRRTPANSHTYLFTAKRTVPGTTNKVGEEEITDTLCETF
ncbi:MAG TPA: hypothetical protein PK397_06230 [Ignavibacteriaceae bacterium]|nr:hypothetical protein [Ignavibacteriaceae bacterium]